MSGRRSPSAAASDKTASRRVPSGAAVAVMYDSDCTCCVCQAPGKPVQVHHLDGNKKNRLADNLAVLCLEHHHEATIRSGLGRKLSAGVIRKYRDQWYQAIRHRRRPRAAAPRPSLAQQEQTIEAVARLEARKVAWLLEKARWPDVPRLLEQLDFYTDFRFSDSVLMEVMEGLYALACKAWPDMPPEVASKIESMVLPTMGIWSLVAPARRRVSEEQVALLKLGLEVGRDLAYVAVRYTGSLKIAASGARVMFYALRYAELNQLLELTREALKVFEELEALASQRKFDDARRWLAFERQNALAIGDRPPPEYPRDIAGLA